jgi:hypothetical protein
MLHKKIKLTSGSYVFVCLLSGTAQVFPITWPVEKNIKGEISEILGDCRNSFFALFLFFLAIFYSPSPNLASLNNLHGLFWFFGSNLDWLASQPIQIRPRSKSTFLFYSRVSMYSPMGSILWERTV